MSEHVQKLLSRVMRLDLQAVALVGIDKEGRPHLLRAAQGNANAMALVGCASILETVTHREMVEDLTAGEAPDEH